MPAETLCTAFLGERRLAGGPKPLVALAVRDALLRDPAAPILVFEDTTGAAIDFDLRGTEAEVLARLAPPASTPRSRGRPRLGVVSREVTLLPRQWEWLEAQPGGASAILRRLVDAAQRADGGALRAKAARAAAFRFLSTMAGDLPGFEEAARALFAEDMEGFAARMEAWPEDIRAHAISLAQARD